MYGYTKYPWDKKKSQAAWDYTNNLNTSMSPEEKQSFLSRETTAASQGFKGANEAVSAQAANAGLSNSGFVASQIAANERARRASLASARSNAILQNGQEDRQNAFQKAGLLGNLAQSQEAMDLQRSGFDYDVWKYENELNQAADAAKADDEWRNKLFLYQVERDRLGDQRIDDATQKNDFNDFRDWLQLLQRNSEENNMKRKVLAQSQTGPYYPDYLRSYRPNNQYRFA